MLDEVKEGVLYMKTHELEKELGISKHTIFYYEKEGIVTPGWSSRRTSIAPITGVPISLLSGTRMAPIRSTPGSLTAGPRQGCSRSTSPIH